MPYENECLSRDGVGEQVAAGLLRWKGSAPSLGKRMVTREWFNTYVLNKGGFTVDKKLMTWAEMKAARALGPTAPPKNIVIVNESTCVPDPYGGEEAMYALRISWTNGDYQAHTEVYRDGNLWTTVSPGVSAINIHQYDIPIFSQFSVRHVKDGLYSDFAGPATGSTGTLRCGGGGGPIDPPIRE